jgi:Nucleotidyltransferase of unknown function (DUF6036)
MRRSVDQAKLEEFMRAVGERAAGPGIIYLVGGSTALLLGLREQTIDIDIKLDPEPCGVFEAIARLKESLELNVELAAPDQFIPPLPGWRERSPHVMTAGKVEFRHYDLYSQALAKIERGHTQDLADARAYLAQGFISAPELKRLFEAIQPELIRYPAIDPGDFARKVRRFLEAQEDGGAS